MIMQGIADGLDGIFRFLIVSVFILIPLSVWKIIDIVIWVYSNVEVNLK